MKKLSYSINISAPAQKVYETMLAPKTYSQWTAEFGEHSRYEGSWEQGAKIIFIGSAEGEKREGMVAEIAENIPNEFVSIRHYGILDGDDEITEGPKVDEWANSFENYRFNEKDGVTTVQVDVDTNEKYLDFFDKTWPKALNKLKQISE